MYLPLQSGLSDHTRIYYLPEERLEHLFQASTHYLSDTKEPAISYSVRTFNLKDTEEPWFFYGKRTFRLSDTEELEFFYRQRLESVSKEIIDTITDCLFRRLAARLSEKYLEEVRGMDLSKTNKDG
jgi:hypothetical protein